MVLNGRILIEDGLKRKDTNIVYTRVVSLIAGLKIRGNFKMEKLQGTL